MTEDLLEAATVILLAVAMLAQQFWLTRARAARDRVYLANDAEVQRHAQVLADQIIDRLNGLDPFEIRITDASRIGAYRSQLSVQLDLTWDGGDDAER